MVENNIVQTIASAVGTLSSIIFVLPALPAIGWWARTGQRRRCVHWAGSRRHVLNSVAAHSSPDQTRRTQKALLSRKFSKIGRTPHGRWSTTVGELGYRPQRQRRW